MTAASLLLLDIPFEPGLAVCGEAFDRLCEHLSTGLSHAVALSLSGRRSSLASAQVFDPDLSTRRSGQNALRRAVLAGRLPGSTISLQRTQAHMSQVTVLLCPARAYEPLAATLEPTLEVLAAMGEGIEAYREHRHRCETRLRSQTTDRTWLAHSAARGERNLLRHLGDAALLTQHR